MVALHELENARQIQLLMTSVEHGLNKPNGVALVLMARGKRPGIRAIFIGPPSAAHWVGGLGALVAPQADIEEMVATVAAMLEAEG